MCQAVKDMIYEERILTLIELVRDDSLSIEKAAAKASMTVDQFKDAMNKILQEKN